MHGDERPENVLPQLPRAMLFTKVTCEAEDVLFEEVLLTGTTLAGFVNGVDLVSHLLF